MLNKCASMRIPALNMLLRQFGPKPRSNICTIRWRRRDKVGTGKFVEEGIGVGCGGASGWSLQLGEFAMIGIEPNLGYTQGGPRGAKGVVVQKSSVSSPLNFPGVDTLVDAQCEV